MSHCDHCQNEIPKRSVYLDRNVMFLRYKGIGNSFDEIAANSEGIMLYSDSINRFCSAGCAEIGVPQTLHSLGLKILPSGVGPIATCAKCHGPVNLMEPHIAYDLMEATNVSKSGQIHLKVHHAESLCVVCNKCDGNLMESEWLVAYDQEAELSQFTRFESKERV